MPDETPLEDYQVKNPDGYRAVGDVEHRAEKYLASEERNPFREGEERKIQHIDNLALQKPRVVEDEAVEHAVDDVAQGSSDEERDAKQGPELHAFLHELEEKPEQKHHRSDTEHAEENLAPLRPRNLPSECHAVVLDKQYVKPFSQHWDGFTHRHRRLDQHL